jgi:DNA-binding transcriptional regulator YhcF (GntR family)
VRIDHESDCWPYEQVAAHFRERIRAGELAPGARLPSLQELAADTGLTVKTIQRAMRLLESEGLVTVRPNRGTFVRRPG